MLRLTAALGVSLMMSTAAWAQINGPAPAELPPEGFDEREFVDSRGCVFMRTTFAGEVTWVPRYGPDRQIVCGETPTLTEVAEETAPAEEEAAPAATTQVEVVPQPAQAAPAAPQRTARAPQRRALPRADASGRHPSCPAKAPYGELVTSVSGRVLVRCVTSPALFEGQYFDHPVQTARAAKTLMPRHGAMVQVGSFAVPSNATRLRARLQNAGLPAQMHHVGGLTVVSVGPFHDRGQAHSALSQVRHMGFHDAFLR
ncbi:MAG: SPOR domain-containing protein [Rhodobacteraceae bacterium]|nr:MAG: SPOR domain-containing protein [Paracoccaceae bacterium]